MTTPLKTWTTETLSEDFELVCFDFLEVVVIRRRDRQSGALSYTPGLPRLYSNFRPHTHPVKSVPKTP